MKRTPRWILTFVTILLVVCLVVPLLIPLSPLSGTQPPIELADSDSRFIQLNGINVHYKQAGSGTPVFLLLHGFASSEFTWREVLLPFGEMGTAIAYDRPAFGLTERPRSWTGPNPYSPEAQLDLIMALLDASGAHQAVLVGNSAGGSIAASFTLRYPERVQALVLVDAAIYSGGGSPALIRPFFQLPQFDRLGVLVARQIGNWGDNFARSAWHDPAKITTQIWEGYRRPLKAENWDLALWELTKASQSGDIASQIGQLHLPVLVISGDDDRIVPAEQSLRLASELPDAELVVIPDCGHVPQEECPQQFLEAVKDFINRRLLPP